MNLKNKIKNFRKQQSMTQLQLAQIVGVSRQSIYAIETGRSEPSLVLSMKIASALNSSVHDLFELEAPVSTETEALPSFSIF